MRKRRHHCSRWIPTQPRFVVFGSFPRATGALQVASTKQSSKLNFLQLYELEETSVRCIHETEAPNALRCGSFGAMFGERSLATGDLGGKLRLWDLQNPEHSLCDTEAHSGAVNGMDGFGGSSKSHGPPEIATCGRDGCVRVFDVRQIQTPVASFQPTANSVSRFQFKAIKINRF